MCIRDSSCILPFPRRAGARLTLFVNLLSQVILKPHLLDRLNLGLDPVDVLIHILRHVFKHVARGEISHLRTMHHPVAQKGEHFLFGLEIKLQPVSYTHLFEMALTKRLVIIGTVAANAPYIGLLGTVLGIMMTFHTTVSYTHLDVYKRQPQSKQFL